MTVKIVCKDCKEDAKVYDYGVGWIAVCQRCKRVIFNSRAEKKEKGEEAM